MASIEQVFHENSLPSEIVFTVHTPPTFGFLQRWPPGEEQPHDARDRQHLDLVSPSQGFFFFFNLGHTGGRYEQNAFVHLLLNLQGPSAESADSFTQEDINQGRVLYHQRAVGGGSDFVRLRVTNGITDVGPFRVDFDVVPVLLPLQVKQMAGGGAGTPGFCVG